MADAIPGDAQRVVSVHPWDRSGEDPAVYIDITYGIMGHSYNIVVDRAEFVEGLLFAFPELTRREID